MAVQTEGGDRVTEGPPQVLLSVGVDLSMTATGLAYYRLYEDGTTHCHSRRIGREGISTLGMSARALTLSRLAVELYAAIIYTGQPDVVVVEGLDSSRRYGAVSERAYLWYAVISGLAEQETPIVEVMSQRLKIFATGRNNASKRDVIAAVSERWPLFPIQGDDNMADAAVLAAIGMELAGLRQPVPDEHRRFLRLLKLPSKIPKIRRIEHGQPG